MLHHHSDLQWSITGNTPSEKDTCLRPHYKQRNARGLLVLVLLTWRAFNCKLRLRSATVSSLLSKHPATTSNLSDPHSSHTTGGLRVVPSKPPSKLYLRHPYPSAGTLRSPLLSSPSLRTVGSWPRLAAHAESVVGSTTAPSLAQLVTQP